ncbi:hypothetical protein Tco_0143898 [Tanacetum coccineum]
MRELREDTFSRNKDEDAHDHIDRVDRLAPGTINTRDLLKKAFIQRYCPPSLTAKQLEDIHNFKQEGDESLYQAWDRYNDLLYKFPTHDINSHQKVNIFYKGLSTMNHQLLDSQGPIPGMRPAHALTAIQTMADHSQKWHDGTTSRNIRSNSSNDGLAALVNKLDNLGRDMKKLKESVHAIQVRYGEFGRRAPFNRSNGGKFRVGPPGYYTKIDNRPPYGKKRQSLEELLAKHQEESARRSTKMEETSGLNKLRGVSFISDPESDGTEVLQHQLPRKELNPRNFILPCTIAKYGKSQTDALIWDSRYAEWCNISPSFEASSQESNKSRPRYYTFREWTLIKVRNTDISEPMKKELLKLWLIDCFQDNSDCENNLTYRSFDDYKWEFNLEIDKLSDEYKLGMGKKGHILDHIWEYCNQVHNKNYVWHNYEFENEECEEIGIEDKDYHPPEAQVETFEVKKYSFKGGQSFICVTKDLDNTLPIGRKNGSKFKEMIRMEIANNKT